MNSALENLFAFLNFFYLFAFLNTGNTGTPGGVPLSPPMIDAANGFDPLLNLKILTHN